RDDDRELGIGELRHVGQRYHHGTTDRDQHAEVATEARIGPGDGREVDAGRIGLVDEVAHVAQAGAGATSADEVHGEHRQQNEERADARPAETPGGREDARRAAKAGLAVAVALLAVALLAVALLLAVTLLLPVALLAIALPRRGLLAVALARRRLPVPLLAIALPRRGLL